jgi:hypothetical protein
VKWVNPIGGSQMKNKIGRSILKTRLGNLSGALAALKQGQPPVIQEPHMDDLPF